MNFPIEQLFNRLQATDEAVQNHAVAEFAMFLEQNLYPEREEEIWRVILPDDLFGLIVSEPEITEMVSAAIALVDSQKLDHGCRRSLMGILVNDGRAENAEKFFAWFSEMAESFDEAQAFSFLACFGLFLLRVEDVQVIRRLVLEFNTMKSLDLLQQKDSKRLSESIFRVRKQLNEMGSE